MPQHVRTRPTLHAVDHSFLHVATLAQATEHPRLLPLLEQAVERAITASHPFPHTMLTGGCNTSKRVLARAIAADLVAPLAELDLSAMRTPDQLHERLSSLDRGSIVLASGVEQALHGPLPDLVSAALCGRCVQRSIPGSRYEPFTIILCTRDPMPAVLAGRDMFDHRFYLSRTEETEAVRLRRVLRRAGATCEDGAVAALAEGVISMRLPTVGTASAVVALLTRRGTTHLDRAQVDEDCWKTLMLLADPRWLRTLARRERRKAEAAAGTATPAVASGPVANGAVANAAVANAAPAPVNATPECPPPASSAPTPAQASSQPPRASDGGGLANAA